MRPLTARAFALTLAALAAAGCRGKPVTRDECDRLLDRYADMRAHADNPHVSATELDQHREKVRARAADDPSFRACTRDVSREQMDCALAAFNPDEIERCLVPVP